MSITTVVLIGIGVVLFLVGILRKPTREPLGRRELDALCDSRAEYFPQLKQAIDDYINRVEFLAKNTDNLYDIKLLRETYMSNRIFKFKRQALKENENRLSVLALLRYNIYKDNIIHGLLFGGQANPLIYLPPTMFS